MFEDVPLEILGWIAAGAVTLLGVLLAEWLRHGSDVKDEARQRLTQTQEIVYRPLRKQVLRMTQQERNLTEGTPIDGLDQNFSPVLMEGRLLGDLHRDLREDVDDLEANARSHGAAFVDYANTKGAVALASAGDVPFRLVEIHDDDEAGGPFSLDLEEGSLADLVKEAGTVLDSYPLAVFLHKNDYEGWKKQLRSSANQIARLCKADEALPIHEDLLREAFEKAYESLAVKRLLYDETGEAVVHRARSILEGVNRALDAEAFYRRVEL